MTTLLLTALLMTAPDPEAMTALSRAQADVATARELQAACWEPRECAAADKLVEATEDAMAASWRLAGGDGADDPFEEYANPFRDDWPPFAGTPFPGDAEVAAIVAEGAALIADGAGLAKGTVLP